MIRKFATASAVVLLAYGMGSSYAHASTYYFQVVTDPSSPAYTVDNVNIAQAAFSLETKVSGSDVVLEFKKISSGDASLTDIYLDTTSTGLSTTGIMVGLDSGTGVSFSDGATPPDLPAPNGLGFTADYGADSNSGQGGTAANGLDVLNEWVQVIIGTTTSTSVGVIDSLLQAGGLLTGIHVQSIGSGGVSLALINLTTPNQAPPEPVPLPAALLLLLSALGGLGFLRRFGSKPT